MFAYDLILQIENPKECAKNLLKLINMFNQLYSIKSMYKPQLYTLAMYNSKIKLRKQFHFVIASKKKKKTIVTTLYSAK